MQPTKNEPLPCKLQLATQQKKRDKTQKWNLSGTVTVRRDRETFDRQPVPPTGDRSTRSTRSRSRYRSYKTWETVEGHQNFTWRAEEVCELWRREFEIINQTTRWCSVELIKIKCKISVYEKLRKVKQSTKQFSDSGYRIQPLHFKIDWKWVKTEIDKSLTNSTFTFLVILFFAQFRMIHGSAKIIMFDDEKNANTYRRRSSFAAVSTCLYRCQCSASS